MCVRVEYLRPRCSRLLTSPPLLLMLQFPYPILNKLPFPAGYVAFVLLGFSVVLGSFHLGRAVKRRFPGGGDGVRGKALQAKRSSSRTKSKGQ